MLAKRIERIGFSPTLAVNDLARKLRAEGVDVLDFSAGQPDFPTPESVKRAGAQAIADDQTRYTANAGIPELRESIADRIWREYKVEYGADQVLVSPGAKASLYFAFMTLIDPGDEVLVPSPYWTSYPEQVRLAGGEPVFVDCPEAGGFRLEPDRLEAAITPRSKVLLLNYPSNPTGASYGREQLEALAAVCVRHKLWVVADEIYSKLLYDGRRFVSLTQIGREVRERTLLIDGMSKSYSMTGWRIGYAVGPAAIIGGMSKLQSHSTSNATSISQWASVAALELPEQELEPRLIEFQRRRDEVVSRLRAIPGVSCVEPEGAFYVFPNVSGVLAQGAGSALDGTAGLAQYLLEEARVAVVPGEAFGSREHVRLSYAVSLERVTEGMERIREALARLTRS